MGGGKLEDNLGRGCYGFIWGTTVPKRFCNKVRMDGIHNKYAFVYLQNACYYTAFDLALLCLIVLYLLIGCIPTTYILYSRS